MRDIKFKDFIGSLISNLLYSYGVNTKNIELILDIDDFYIGLDTSIPCGLIINELVTNSLKYAFPEGEGIIEIKLRKNKDDFNLIISDNGFGLPKDIEL